MDLGILYIAIGFAVGGILKGATGAGAPIVAIPIMSLYFNVPIAVAVFIVPNLVSNTLQVWTHRKARIGSGFLWRFVVAGVAGAAVGTWILAKVHTDALKLAVAVAVVIFIAFRLLRPEWKLAMAAAKRVAAPVGLVAGVLQGMSGISAPVSITFLNAMHLTRPSFISTISIFFLSMLLVQIPMLTAYGYLTGERLLIGCAATAVLLGFMPLGAFLARRVSPAAFNRVILVLLGVLALRLFWDVLAA